MKKRFGVRAPSPAMAVALAALFVALGGTSYAATTLANNSVGTKQLKNGAVTTKKLKNNAVTAPKINTTGLTVPNALFANKAGTAGSATNANHASTADNATNANHASTADNATNAGHASTADVANGVATLPSGQSESGFYAAASGSAGYIGQGITYVQPLRAAIPDANVISNPSGTTSAHCSGYGHADPGYLCLYDNEQFGIGNYGPFRSSEGFSTPSPGLILYWHLNSGGGYVSGEYTVTAP